MQEVNVREFRERMSFYLNNLPIVLTRGGVAIAQIIPATVVYTGKGDLCTQEAYTPPKSKIEQLQAEVDEVAERVKADTQMWKLAKKHP